MNTSRSRPPIDFVRRKSAEFLHQARRTRDQAIIDGVVGIAPDSATNFLDVGCSDGRIAEVIASQLGADPTGVDVEIQSTTSIPTHHYDGRRLPFESGQFDFCTIIDVLHHAEDPKAVVCEALRVVGPQGVLIIKDHVRRGWWSNWVLGRMDTASNYGTHEITAGTYLTLEEWRSLMADCDGEIKTLKTPFRVHTLPWRTLARDSYHLLMTVVPAT